jgi:hypothetical protein
MARVLIEAEALVLAMSAGHRHTQSKIDLVALELNEKASHVQSGKLVLSALETLSAPRVQ